MTIRLLYVHFLEPLYLCQMPTRGHLGPNLDFQVKCNISFVLYYKIFRQDLCRSNDTTALVILPRSRRILYCFSFFFFFFLLTLPAQRGRVLYWISFFLLSSYPACAAGQGLILHQFLSSSSVFYLSTCQHLRHPRSDYAHTWSK